MSNSGGGDDRPFDDEGEERVRIVDPNSAREAIEKGQAIGRRNPAAEAKSSPVTASGSDRTASMPRFPLPASGRATSVVPPRQQAFNVTSADDVIDLRDADSGEEPEDRDLETAAGGMPHWSEGASGGGEEGADALFADLGAASGLGYGHVLAAGGDDTENNDETMDSRVDETEKPDDNESGEADKGAMARAAALGSSPSLVKRVATGVAFAVAALAAFAAGPQWVLALTTVVLLLAAAEVFDALRRVGFKPATLLALVAIAGTILGAYARGEAAIALMVALTTVFTFLWYLIGITKASPTSNIGVTVMSYAWIGVLGAFAGLLLRMPDHRGLAFLIGAILVTIAYDTGAYLGGSVLGRRPLAPAISPTKTWEGLAVGTVAALAVGALLVQAISPWGVVSGLLLGITVAVVAPLGDLAESMVKRDLGLKDMGRILPGHGGILDRFDALLFVIPATYYLVRVLNLG